MMKILYKPLGMAAGVLGGVLASAIFKRVWKLAAGEDEAPKAEVDITYPADLSDRRAFGWPLAKDGRQHAHSRIDSAAPARPDVVLPPYRVIWLRF
jgi:hypothetical protein